MKVLVTGGAGYIGGAVTDALVQGGVPFTVYDNLLYEQHYFKPVDFIFGDVRDTKKLKQLLPQYTHVIWLSAIVADAACEVNPQIATSINQDTVKWLSENFDGRVIFTSTCSIYGQREAACDEKATANPLSLYARTKWQAEKYLQSENHLIFRLGTVFGVSDTYARLRLDLPIHFMIAHALTKGEIVILGGNQWRPFIHVKDIGQAIVRNLNRPIHGVYNLASYNLQIQEIAKIVNEIVGCKVEHKEQDPADHRDYRVDTKKALRDNIFGSAVVRTVREGVREIVELISSGRVKDVENDIYFNARYITNLAKKGGFI